MIHVEPFARHAFFQRRDLVEPLDAEDAERRSELVHAELRPGWS